MDFKVREQQGSWGWLSLLCDLSEMEVLNDCCHQRHQSVDTGQKI